GPVLFTTAYRHKSPTLANFDFMIEPLLMNHRSRDEHLLHRTTPSIAVFWTKRHCLARAANRKRRVPDCSLMLRRFSAAVATSREGRRSRVRSLGTPQQLALRLFQGAPRPYWHCRSLRQLMKCEHTLQSFSDRLRPQTNIHSSARSAAPRTRARLP